MKKQLLFLTALLCSVAVSAKTLYLKAGTVDFTVDGAVVAIWTWGGSDADAWSVFQSTGTTGISSTIIAEGRTGGKIVRFPGGTTPDWNAAKWNETGDLTWDSSKDCMELIPNSDNSWNGLTGVIWTNYDGSDDTGNNNNDNGGGNTGEETTTGADGHTFWLIGYFDGQDKGDASDFNSTYDEYKFQNGKLAVQFTNNSGDGYSYACIKDNEGNWYMTKAWNETINTGNPCTLYWTGYQYAEPNKWRLPNAEQLYLIMTKCNFKDEIELKMADKATFDAFSPEEEPNGLETLPLEALNIQNGTITANGDLRIFTVTGQDVTAQNGYLNGLYIVTINGKAAKVLVR